MPTYTTNNNLQKPNAGETDRQQDVSANLDVIDRGMIPVGGSISWPGDTAPTGFHLEDGSALSKSANSNQYLPLFNIIGYKYGGSGDSFHLRDMRGCVPVVLAAGDANFGTLGQVGGEKTHILLPSEMPSHTHSYDTKSNTVTAASGNQNAIFHSTVGGTTGVAGGDVAHNNIQPYIVTNWIMRVW